LLTNRQTDKQQWTQYPLPKMVETKNGGNNKQLENEYWTAY